MKLTTILLLVSLSAGAQTKKTEAQLKAITKPTSSMYYLVKGKDTTYYKWRSGYYAEQGDVIITPKAKGGGFVKYVPSVKPVAGSTVYNFKQTSFSSSDASLSSEVVSLNKNITVKGARQLVIALGSNTDTSVAIAITTGNQIGALYLTNPSAIDSSRVYPSINDLAVVGAGYPIAYEKPYDLINGQIEITRKNFDVTVSSGGKELLAFRVVGKAFMQAGPVVIYPFKAGDNTGQISVQTQPDGSALSNISAGEIRPEDWGWKKVHTWGEFETAGSYRMKVIDPTLFEVGKDYLMAMNEPNRYKQGPGGWGFIPDPATDTTNRRNYYFADPLGSAYRGRVVSKNGYYVTFNNPCAIAYKGEVWSDGYRTLNSITTTQRPASAKATIILSDTLVSSEPWHFKDCDGWAVKGTNKACLYTPYGVPEWLLTRTAGTNNIGYEDFEINTNVTMNNYAVRWWGSDWNNGKRYLNSFGEATIDLNYNSYHKNITFTNPGRQVTRISGTHSSAINTIIKNPNRSANYSGGQWLMVMTGSFNSIINPTINNLAELRPSIESFAGEANQVIGVKGTNILFSSNGGYDWTVDGWDVDYTEGSENQWQEGGFNPIANFNNNNYYGTGKNGTFKNFNIRFKGFTDTVNKRINGLFAVQASVAGVVIEKGRIESPVFVQAVGSYAKDLTLKDMVVNAPAGQGGQIESSNIGIAYGRLENVTAPVITLGFAGNKSTVTYFNLKGDLFVHRTGEKLQ